jgi:predicted  nucleic acid-binding Zn-ribbon protein
MGQKGSGIERFLAPSLTKIEEELRSILVEINSVKSRIDETDQRLTKLEEEQNRFTIKLDKTDDGMTAESKVLFDSINEMERQNRGEIEVLKRAIDVAQRRLVILEDKMKDLGQ